MDLTRQMDSYCERVDLTFWAEPVNAVTNAAFLIAAVWMWRRAVLPDGRAIAEARWLAGVLFAIGVGSFLFHTFATVWAVILDVTPILVFTLSYIFLAMRDYLALRTWVAAAITALFFPYAYVLVPIIRELPFFGISDGYWPIMLLIALVGLITLRRLPEVGRGLLLGAGILTLSITLRSLDLMLCETVPLGTHFLWHYLNGIMLGWMIEVYRRHRVGQVAALR